MVLLLFSGHGSMVGLPCLSLQIDSFIHTCFSVVPLGSFIGTKQAFLGLAARDMSK